MKNLVLLLILAFLYGPTAQAQITRGAQPGEIYIATDWYADNTGMFYKAIFRSTDSGEHLALQYETLYNPPPGEMRLGRVLGDAATGALYNWGWHELWVSFDYGVNWEYREDYPDYTKYFTGVNQGLIFKGNYQGFFKSTDYELSFELLPITVSSI